MSAAIARPPLLPTVLAFGAVYFIWGTTYTYVNPMVALLVGALVAGEVMTSEIKVAAPLIVLSVVIISLPGGFLGRWKR